MPSRWRWVGLLAAVGIATPRPARADVEVSARVPMGVAVGDGTRFELGLRSDVLYQLEASDLYIGVTGEVRSISFANRAQEIAAWLDPSFRNCTTGPEVSAGFGTAGPQRYVFGRGSYQFRVSLADHAHARFRYALSGGIFLGLRYALNQPRQFEGIVGVEVGGGLLTTLFLAMKSIVMGGG